MSRVNVFCTELIACFLPSLSSCRSCGPSYHLYAHSQLSIFSFVPVILDHVFVLAPRNPESTDVKASRPSASFRLSKQFQRSNFRAKTDSRGQLMTVAHAGEQKARNCSKGRSFVGVSATTLHIRRILSRRLGEAGPCCGERSVLPSGALPALDVSGSRAIKQLAFHERFKRTVTQEFSP